MSVLPKPSETGVPLIQVTSYELSDSLDNVKPLPQLPSHKFRYTVWHELRSTQVTGDQLKAPRVREGPESKENTFYETTDDSGQPIHHDRTGSDRKQYRDQQENWETSLKANLSYQKLEHAYQVKNFMRILRRLRVVEDVNLTDNSLHNLHGVSFPRCRVANLSRNYFTSFTDLPSMPLLTHLVISFNQIRDCSGLSRYPRLESLDLRGSDVYYSSAYRQKIFNAVPSLKVLDGVLKTEADTKPLPVELDVARNSCTIV